MREEIHHIREGKHGARSTKQVIAIGLSKARRAGVKLEAAEVEPGSCGKEGRQDHSPPPSSCSSARGHGAHQDRSIPSVLTSG